MHTVCSAFCLVSIQSMYSHAVVIVHYQQPLINEFAVILHIKYQPINDKDRFHTALTCGYHYSSRVVYRSRAMLLWVVLFWILNRQLLYVRPLHQWSIKLIAFYILILECWNEGKWMILVYQSMRYTSTKIRDGVYNKHLYGRPQGLRLYNFTLRNQGVYSLTKLGQLQRQALITYRLLSMIFLVFHQRVYLSNLYFAFFFFAHWPVS